MPDGREFAVSTPTSYCGALRFADGAVATLFTSYDVTATRVPPIEVYGTEGTLSLPDPDFFDGVVAIGDAKGWRELPATHPTGRGRGIGVAELARAITSGETPRASGELGLHVLDAMTALLEGGRRLAIP